VIGAKEGKQVSLGQYSKESESPVNVSRSQNSTDNITCYHDLEKIDEVVFQWHITKADNI